jgi:hypothetical protein
MDRKPGVVRLLLAALIVGGAGLAAGPITDCWPDIPPPPSAPTQVKAPPTQDTAPDETLA